MGNFQLQVLLSHQPRDVGCQDRQACCPRLPSDSSGQQHGCLALSMDEIEDRIHRGLQHVKTIATGRVLRLICETSNTYYLSLYHVFKSMGINSSVFVNFSDRPCNVLLVWSGLDPKNTSAMASCGQGPTLEWGRANVWEIDQPRRLPQPSICGYVLQQLPVAACPTRHSYVLRWPWREDCYKLATSVRKQTSEQLSVGRYRVPSPFSCSLP